MHIMTIDTSKTDQLPAAFNAAMRSATDKIIFVGSAPQYEQRAKEAGILVDVQSPAQLA